MDKTGAFGHINYGRPDGHDNISLSTIRDSIRNIDLESGNIDESSRMPTGRHIRRTTSVGTGMIKDFSKTNNKHMQPIQAHIKPIHNHIKPIQNHLKSIKYRLISHKIDENR